MEATASKRSTFRSRRYRGRARISAKGASYTSPGHRPGLASQKRLRRAEGPPYLPRSTSILHKLRPVATRISVRLDHETRLLLEDLKLRLGWSYSKIIREGILLLAK